jgi:hypothetical protein
MHKLKSLLLERLSSGLKRKSLTKPSNWACAVRMMGPPFPGPWTFKYHPWLKEMHDSTAEMNIGQKGAQLGFTETVLNLTFFKIDVEGLDCLYVLPAKTPDAGDFSAGRFDPALENSPHLSKLFNDVKNVGHKRAGTANLYIRGSKSRSGLKSIPTGFIVLDEVDEFVQRNISLAFERASGQVKRQFWLISTPTIENYGINSYFIDSSQEEFFFKCPSCTRLTNLVFPECLEITADHPEDINITKSFIKCKECKNELKHETKHEWLKDGIWVPQITEQRQSRGFHVNQLYSSAKGGLPSEIAKSYLLSLRDPAEEQSFYNDKMGVPHAVEGAKITDVQLENCKGSYQNGFIDFKHITTMGIDVGKFLHYEIDSWYIPPKLETSDLNTECSVKVLEAGKVLNFEELDVLMRKHRVNAAVIDCNPERRKAYEFSKRFWGHVKLCFYGQGVQGKQIHVVDTLKTEEPLITVDRTSWLDLSLGRFRNSTISIPQNISLEYRDHLKCLVRTYEKDKDGNPVGRYRKGGGDDHFAHARNYAEIALIFAANMSRPQDIRINI